MTADIGDGPPNGAQPDAAANDAAGAADAAPIPDGPLPDARACLEGDRRTEGADGTCYFGFDADENWVDARAACVANGGDLARIDDSAENDIVFALAQQTPVIDDDWWAGGNDRAIEDTWVWLDDTVEMRGALFVQFRAGEPNDGTADGEDCMILETDTAARTWDDRNCILSSHPYICERPAN